MLRRFMVLVALASLGYGAFSLQRALAKQIQVKLDPADCAAFERTDRPWVVLTGVPQPKRIGARQRTNSESIGRHSHTCLRLDMFSPVLPDGKQADACVVLVESRQEIVHDSAATIPYSDPRVTRAKADFAKRLDSARTMAFSGYLSQYESHPSHWDAPELAQLGLPPGAQIKIIELGLPPPTYDGAFVILGANALWLVLLLTVLRGEPLPGRSYAGFRIAVFVSVAAALVGLFFKYLVYTKAPGTLDDGRACLDLVAMLVLTVAIYPRARRAHGSHTDCEQCKATDAAWDASLVPPA